MLRPSFHGRERDSSDALGIACLSEARVNSSSRAIFACYRTERLLDCIQFLQPRGILAMCWRWLNGTGGSQFSAMARTCMSCMYTVRGVVCNLTVCFHGHLASLDVSLAANFVAEFLPLYKPQQSSHSKFHLGYPLPPTWSERDCAFSASGAEAEKAVNSAGMLCVEE